MHKRGLRFFESLGTYTRLAPSVDKDWVQQFVLEQRLLGAPGTRIGDSLALVESHVAESGESAQSAFGDPQRYAKEDAPEQTVRPSDRIDHGWGLGIGLGLGGMLLSTFSAQAGFSGESTLHVTVGLLVVLAIVVGSVALVFLASRTVLRLLTNRLMRNGIGWVLWLAATAGALFFLSHPVGEIRVSSALLVGAILLTAGLLVQLRAYLAGRVQEDPIVGPGEQPTKSRAGLASVVIFPVATMVMIGFSWLIEQIPELF